MKVGKSTRVRCPELSNIHPTVEIGNECSIHSHVWIGVGVRIGNYCKVEAFAFIPEGVTIEDFVFIGPRVTFTNDKHPKTTGKWELLRTVVKEHASIGAGAVILPGVIIGEGAKIGAGAVVTKNVPRGATVVGNPAKSLKP